ncbi:hypothetical protein PIB30_090686 [Stylosanthes scabra]|uniref:PB1-like domain-containing protein n=1 Tax=Stylosanthes scabra TaxID=79078 RepID=A0ABU6ZT24_9FABA|nr:hypothetical protein [Stylosanthes scabra]
MGIDFVNYSDLVKLLESIGYSKFKCMKWYDIVEDDLERVLHKLKWDKQINEMCDQVMRNIGLVDEFHIYVEHEVDIPILADEDLEPNVEIVLEDNNSASSLPSSTDDGLPCVHGMAAITKKRENPEDFVHNWLCMTSIHATYKSFISPMPSEEY